MSVNDAIKDMIYGHEHRWRVAEHELAQARAEAVALREEVEAMRPIVEAARKAAATWFNDGRINGRALVDIDDGICALDALRARKVGG